MADETKTTPWNATTIATTIVTLIFFVLYSTGAAKLAYTRNSSMALAIGAFIFSPFYYPYYAFTQPAPTVMGAARKLKGLW